MKILDQRLEKEALNISDENKSSQMSFFQKNKPFWKNEMEVLIGDWIDEEGKQYLKDVFFDGVKRDKNELIENAFWVIIEWAREKRGNKMNEVSKKTLERISLAMGNGKIFSDEELTGICHSCDKDVYPEDFQGKDFITKKEFTISTLCPKCQAKIWKDESKKDMDKLYLSESKMKRLSGLNENRTNSKLFNKSSLDKFPVIGSQKGKKIKEINVVESFSVKGRRAWFLCEYNEKENMFFGYIKDEFKPENDKLGYIKMSLLESVRGIEKMPSKGLTLDKVISKK